MFSSKLTPSSLTFALAELNTLKYMGILSRGGVLSRGFVIEEDNILNVSDQNEIKK